MSSRRRLTKLARVRIFDAACGICHICEQPIRKQPWDIDHIKPLWLGGADDESNMRPAHIRCHQDKTSAEAPVRAKGTRIRARHIGVKKPTTFRGWRKFNGTLVFANDDSNE
jgi:5-methylcytosine-specific restriction protein A